METKPHSPRTEMAMWAGLAYWRGAGLVSSTEAGFAEIETETLLPEDRAWKSHSFYCMTSAYLSACPPQLCVCVCVCVCVCARARARACVCVWKRHTHTEKDRQTDNETDWDREHPRTYWLDLVYQGLLSLSISPFSNFVSDIKLAMQMCIVMSAWHFAPIRP